MSPKEWYERTIGKKIDTDNYPRSNPFQCWDYFDYFCRVIGFSGSRYCASTGYVGDLWLLRDTEGYHYYTDFDYVTDPKDFKNGDWVFWQKHVAMFYEGMELGQNQPAPYVTLKTMSWGGILGAMRWKHWQYSSVNYGKTKFTAGNRSYSLWRMSGKDRIGVISPGLNCLAKIQEMDINAAVEAKITGANYFQMETDKADPHGTTYGDISAPLCGVYQSLPNQDTTLFYDLETGRFGDCTDVVVNSSHNVFSPSLVFPNSKGHWEYARMVGLSHKDYKSRYTFLIRYSDGYALGVAEQDCTPQEIADDFAQTEMVNIAFLDGGGSAQAAFWYDGSMHYEVDNKRACPSALAIYRIPEEPVSVPVVPEEEPEAPVIPPEEPETPSEDEEEPVEEEIPMEENKPSESAEIEPVPGWHDPEPQTSLIKERIASLLSVKSILTLALTACFGYLIIHQLAIPEYFAEIYKIVILFFFGYQTGKSEVKK